MANLIIKPTSGGSLILQDEGGSAAVTVGTSGATTFAESITLSGTTNNIGTVTAGSLAFQSMVVWRMVNSETKGDQNPLGAGGSDWELSDDIESEFYLGSSTQITESSGVFSFGSTGYWNIRGGFDSSNTTDTVQNMTVKFMASNNGAGGTFTAVAQAAYADSSISTGYNDTIYCECLLKVTNTTNDKFKVYQAADPDTYILGSGTFNRSYVVFQKLANI